MANELDFDHAFECLVGNRPFGWQRRLFVEWLSAGRLPSALDVPTGLGKTSIMAIWLLARAHGADLPRRLVYVVDRRAVVDQATRIAEQLRENMPGDVARGLGLAGDGDKLRISTLRGGFVDNRDWLEDPAGSVIIVGTIDMIGSRLLFEGYGVSKAMRPYHAGLLGVDVLYVLDESHLCRPFEALLQQISDRHHNGLGACADGSDTPPFRLVSLSATGRHSADLQPEAVFCLADSDRREPIVAQRLMAGKRLKIVEIQDPKTLVDQMVGRAIELGTSDPPSRVVIYFNSRREAVEARTKLDGELRRREKAGELPGWTSELLVGERRVLERTALEQALVEAGFLGDAEASPKMPSFLFATSAGEVGVDLDADHMVCDLVAYERMVQRLGRVNRRGGNGRVAMVDVFSAALDEGGGGKSGAAEELLKVQRRHRKPLELLVAGEDERCDASSAALAAVKAEHADVIGDATTPSPLYPELTRPLVEAWAMTSLDQHAGRPEVAPWLRGWVDDDEPQTDVVWRVHLPHVRKEDAVSAPARMVDDFFQAAPVHAAERLEAPTGRVFDWLLKRAGQVQKRDANHELAAKPDEIAAVLLDRAGKQQIAASFGDLYRLVAAKKTLSSSELGSRDRDKRQWRDRFLPGASLIVDARICGLNGGMLDEKSEVKVNAADANEDPIWHSGAGAGDVPEPLIGFRIQEVSGDEDGLHVYGGDENWRHFRTFEIELDTAGTARRGLAIHKWRSAVADENSRSVLSKPQALAEHAEDVSRRVRQIARDLRLSDEEVGAFAKAALLHDNGKAAPRWQNAMRAPAQGRPYAKTSGGGNWRLLEGYRHEFGSLLSAEKVDLPKSIRDLVLHLVASHHGWARPLIDVKGCDAAPPSRLASEAGQAALRYSRLQKRYGPWGLAWLEAIFRAADHSASRDHAEQTEKRKKNA